MIIGQSREPTRAAAVCNFKSCHQSNVSPSEEAVTVLGVVVMAVSNMPVLLLFDLID